MNEVLLGLGEKQNNVRGARESPTCAKHLACVTHSRKPWFSARVDFVLPGNI